VITETITTLAAAIERRETTAEALLDRCLQRIAERNAAIRVAAGEPGFQACAQPLEKLRPSRPGDGEGGGGLRGRTRRPHESIIHRARDAMVAARGRFITAVT